MIIRRPKILVVIGIGIAICLLLAATPSMPTARATVRAVLPGWLVLHLNGYRYGFAADYDVRIKMPDGVQLAATLYRPRYAPSKLPTVLVRLPYDRLQYGEGLRAAEIFASRGYAVLVQDLRGTHASEGEFVPYQHATSDGAATLDWIAQQPWSNGRVGTFGCSALGETQYSLARAKHPAHAAMIPMGAGGAMGSARGRYTYFGLFEGGIFQLASGFGWFHEYGAKNPRAPVATPVNTITALTHLPMADMVNVFRSAPNSFEEFVRTPLADAYWQSLNFVSEGDVLATPALVFNTWGDQTVGETFQLAKYIRQTIPADAARHQHVIIGPGKHCNHEEVGITGKFGDLEVGNAEQPYAKWYVEWFDYWLLDKGDGLANLPPYLYYMIGEKIWLSASDWPPIDSRIERWYTSRVTRANGRGSDGVLARKNIAQITNDEYRYDPLNPAPSIGGPVCCTGNANERTGPVDQAAVEGRDDVLVYSTAPLAAPLRIAGPLHAKLTISSSARDTDFVARLTHVWPDGRSTNIQEGALRARYRNGIAHKALLVANEIAELTIDMRSIAYSVPQGHRLRLVVTSSSFPRLERNLNTGGNNFDESIGVVAVNRVHHGGDQASYIEISTLP